MDSNKIVSLYEYGVYEYKWGSAIRERRTGKWIKIFLKPDAQEIDVENLNVEVHENGIEFL